MFTEFELHTIYRAVFMFEGDEDEEILESILTKLENHFQGR